MTIRPILIHPDPRLKKRAETVETLDDEVRGLVDDLFETMYDAPGIGLAAPQIGVSRRVFVMDCAARAMEEQAAGDGADPVAAAEAATEVGPAPMAFINPEIVWSSEETRVYNEGCLSIPDQFDDVRRPTRVRMRWTDAQGETYEEELAGLMATCAQHELDHLDGKLFIDYLGPVKRAMVTKKMQKLKRERTKK